jgi:hypothetical protein
MRSAPLWADLSYFHLVEIVSVTSSAFFLKSHWAYRLLIHSTCYPSQPDHNGADPLVLKSLFFIASAVPNRPIPGPQHLTMFISSIYGRNRLPEGVFLVRRRLSSMRDLPQL